MPLFQIPGQLLPVAQSSAASRPQEGGALVPAFPARAPGLPRIGQTRVTCLLLSQQPQEVGRADWSNQSHVIPRGAEWVEAVS